MGLQSKLFIQKRSAATSLKQPKELGFYSKSSKHDFLIQDDSRLAYYYFPDAQLEKNFDLTSGIKKFKECTNSPEFDNNTLHGLLSTIQAYEERKQKKLRASIVTFRGVMRKLITAAFDNPKYVNINLRVVAFDGQLFIKEVGDNASKQPSNKNTESMEYRSYYSGYKFETLTTLSAPFADTPRSVIEKRHAKLVNNGEQYITVVKTGIGKCKMILGAEVDCVFDFKEEAADNLKHYAELKCTKGVTTMAEARAFERKIFKTWIQCFLVGINRIIYGFRDANFILRSVEEFTTQEVPLLLKNNPQLSNACLDAIKWYGAFTEWLVTAIPEADCTDLKAYSLIFEHNHLKLAEITETHEEYEDIVKGEGVLSTKFKNWRTLLAQKEDDKQ